MRCRISKRSLIIISSLLILLASCSVNKHIARQANSILLKDSSISHGHIGISIYEPATGKYWYEHDATKYFVPASNTKLFTLYAGMKYLGDSLVGLRYQNINDSTINVFGTGDPTFLHKDFIKQPVLDFLQNLHKKIYLSGKYKDDPLGIGWAWDDYNNAYMAERNEFPIYGNILTIDVADYKEVTNIYSTPNWNVIPKYFKKNIPNDFWVDLNYLDEKKDSSIYPEASQRYTIQRNIAANIFLLKQGNNIFHNSTIPFVVNGIETAIDILKTDYNLNIVKGPFSDIRFSGTFLSKLEIHKLRSQPSDSLFKPMMHRSDNFFAEQTLLMVSNEQLGYMNDEKIIDTLLRTDLKDVPQKPRWVDGSGLSRYNLFTPNSFVYILNKMKDEFGMDRLKNILPTGNEGSLKNYYLNDSGYIFAKTGSLSNNCTLSGYLYTSKGKLLIFSILANNFQSSATPVRRAVEHFLQDIRNRY